MTLQFSRPRIHRIKILKNIMSQQLPQLTFSLTPKFMEIFASFRRVTVGAYMTSPTKFRIVLQSKAWVTTELFLPNK
jgi:hypothetical protein